MRATGFLLVVAGTFALGYPGFTYSEGEEPPAGLALRAGRSVWLPAVAGGIAVVAGVCILTRSTEARDAESRD